MTETQLTATVRGTTVPTKGFQTTSYIVYDQYSVTSDYSSNGSCIITEGVPVALQTPFSYTVTAGENQSEAQYLGLSSFHNFLGLDNCDIGDPPGVTVTPFLLSPTLDSPSVSFSSPDPSTSTSITSTVANVASSVPTDRVKGLSGGQKDAIKTVTYVGATTLLVLAFILWRRTKKQRAKRILRQTVQEERTDDNPPFLQPKPELQGEDSRHEMIAEDRRFELDEANTRYEIMTEEQSRRLNVQVQQHELRGEEAALELEHRDTGAEC